MVVIKDMPQEMMEIVYAGQIIFYGNYWDFDKSPKALAQFLRRVGVSAAVQDLNEYEVDK